jgi:hypothetical protein
MPNPKEVLNEFDKEFTSEILHERYNYRAGEKLKQFIISSQIATLTSQLDAIPEDEVIGTHCDIDIEHYKEGINEERQRQRQSLQDLIKEWTELK